LTALIRNGILNGTLSPALRIPSSRMLATELGLARNTVVSVYEQLQMEGLLVAGHGSGTYICRVAREGVDTGPWRDAEGVSEPASAHTPLSLSARGKAYLHHPMHRYWRPQPFRGALMDASLFPHALWNRIQQQQMRLLDPLDLGEGDAGGLMALKRAIADHIRTARGVRCQPEQVVITDSTTESLELVARLLCDAGDTILLENPCYWAAAQTAADHGLHLTHCDVDEWGLPVPPSSEGLSAPRLVYLTPSNQFPLGNPMSVERRLEWIEYARAHGTVLIEDDYDSEYRFNGEPFPSLQGLDTTDHVVYLGTFSKTLYRGIRIAFIVAPPHLAQVFADASSDFYRDGDLLLQQVLAHFIREGHFATHIRRTRLEYAARREALAQALQQELADAMAAGRASISGGVAGVHLTLRFGAHVDDRALAARCEDMGVTTPPLSAYCLGNARMSGLVLSYAATPRESIAPLVVRIGALLREATR
ncbi:MAG TPA: PLP-dependent aminotransferase family protein, partial [Rhizobacter sp.]|nr:PLP-dependent aminotransferase family protein [Rhizobacter sp.]